MRSMRGAGAHPGQAVGTVVWVQGDRVFSREAPADRAAEVVRLREAIAQAAADLEMWSEAQEQVVVRVALSEYREALQDPAFAGRAVALIDAGGMPAPAAAIEAADQVGAVLARNEEFRGRAVALQLAAEWLAWRLEPLVLPADAIVAAITLNPLVIMDLRHPVLLVGPEPEPALARPAAAGPVVWGLSGLEPSWSDRHVRVDGPVVQWEESEMPYEEMRTAVCQTAKRMWQDGLVKMTSGNISARIPGTDHFVVTPSGMDYETLTPADICVLDLEGNVVDGDRRPSTETPLHRQIYRARPEVNAVVHTHSVYATAFACTAQALEPVSTELAGFVGAVVPCARYARSGTEDFGAAALEALGRERLAALLQNHGVLAVGSSLKKAYNVALGVEEAAMVHALARQLGPVAVIPLEERERIFRDYQRSYGQPKE